MFYCRDWPAHLTPCHGPRNDTDRVCARMLVLGTYKQEGICTSVNMFVSGTSGTKCLHCQPPAPDATNHAGFYA